MKVRLFALSVSILFFSLSSNGQELITLEEAIRLALQKNYDVQLAKNTAEVASANQDYAWPALLPQINATGAVLWNANKQTLEFEDATRNNSGKARSQNTAASVQLNWILFDGTRMFATLERINTLEAQGLLVVKDQMVNTIATVINTYYDIVRQKQQLNATQEQMAVSEERVKLADRKLQVGTGGKPELLQAKVDYNSQRTLVIQQEAVILMLKEQLNALLGSQLPATYEVADSIMIDLTLQKEAIANNLESSNYGLQASRFNLEVAQLSLHERRADLSPVISANGAYNFNQTDNTLLINPFAALFSQTKGFNYGFTVTMPVFNGMNRVREIQQSKINYSRQRLLYDQQRQDVNVALQNAFVSYENAKEILLIEEENILLAKENVFIALEGFKRGIITAIELRTAQQSLADAYNRLINARYLTKVAETELLRLNGALLR